MHQSPIVSNTPLSFFRGTTVIWNDFFPDMESPTWTATISYNNQDFAVTHTGVSDGVGGHDFNIDDSESAAFIAGVYRYQVKLTDGAQTFVSQDAGRVEVFEDLEGLAPTDLRTHAVKTLALIEAELQLRAGGQTSMSQDIEGRSFQDASLEEMEAFRAKYSELVRQEVVDESIAAGRGNPDRIRTLF